MARRKNNNDRPILWITKFDEESIRKYESTLLNHLRKSNEIVINVFLGREFEGVFHRLRNKFGYDYNRHEFLIEDDEGSKLKLKEDKDTKTKDGKYFTWQQAIFKKVPQLQR